LDLEWAELVEADHHGLARRATPDGKRLART